MLYRLSPVQTLTRHVTNWQTFVEEEKVVVDSRDIFRKFPGHLKQREGMLKLNNISRPPKQAEPEVIVCKHKNHWKFVQLLLGCCRRR